MMEHRIYLDYSANTPVDADVLACFCETERRCIGNANAKHSAGRESKDVLTDSLNRMAAALGAQPSEVILTSGASEANNTAMKGILRASRHVGRHVITSALEHASVSGCLTAMQEQGADIDVVSVGRDGRVDVEELAGLLRRDTVLVTLPMVDSELGVIQPVQEVAALLKDYPNCCLHVDATQAVGKIPVTFANADTMSLAAHKFYGLNGSGLLLKREKLAMEPLIHGGASGVPLSQRHAAGRADCGAGAGLGEGDRRPAGAARLCAHAERSAPHGLDGLFPRADQQSRPCGAAHPEPERTGRAGKRLRTGAGCAGCVCVGEVGLFGGGYAVPGSICRQPGQAAGDEFLPHQPQPPDHAGGADAFFDPIRRML